MTITLSGFADEISGFTRAARSLKLTPNELGISWR
jgi:hypothetical protein